MAVISTLAKSALSLKYKEGVDEKGKDIIKTRKFSNIKVTAGDQEMYDVSAAFSPLMLYPVTEVIRTDDTVLMNL
jgi:hypothetical protein